MTPIATTIVPSDAHPETMDFLSRAWCDFAVQSLHPPELFQEHNSLLLLDSKPAADFDPNLAISPAFFSMDQQGMKMDDPDLKSLPPWKSNDLKSWIWMQQAMHPELNYNRKKWVAWKMGSFKMTSIKKWLKEMKMRRKEEGRLERAEVHAAISMAGLAAALAAIADADKSGKDINSTTARNDAVASAAALVAAHCAKVAESMGAKKEQLSSVIGSAMSGGTTGASDILTLTAAATTSLKGAATLKARADCKNRLMNGSVPVLPIEDSHDLDLDFNKNISMLSYGTELHVETPDGDFRVRWVSIIQDRQAKVVLKMRKLNLFKTKMESVVMDIHAELYKDPYEAAEETDTCYLIVLSTNRGVIKLDMGDDYDRYKTWAATITHMLGLSTSLSKYELPFSTN
ncbi:hypothetical protein LINPERHAP2_LOCUS26213 [Linum perenne]